MVSRYMVPQSIANAAGVNVEDLKTIKSLDFGWQRGLKKITIIEHLEPCFHLEKLILSGNAVVKITCLSHLHRLAHLDLRLNNIKEITGLPPNLVILNLSENRIKRLPKSIGNLRHLSVCRLANNKLHKLDDIRNLRRCQSLTTLEYSNNPVTSLDHFFLWTVFTLPTLTILNEETISEEHRESSRTRFKRIEYDTIVESLEKSQEENSGLKKKIEELEAELEQIRLKEQAKSQEIEINSEHMLNMQKKIQCLNGLNQTNNEKLLKLEARNTELEHILERARYFGFDVPSHCLPAENALVESMRTYISQVEKTVKMQLDALDKAKTYEEMEIELKKFTAKQNLLSEFPIKVQHTLRARVKQAEDLREKIRDTERQGHSSNDMVSELEMLIEDSVQLVFDEGKNFSFDEICVEARHLSAVDEIREGLDNQKQILTDLHQNLNTLIQDSSRLYYSILHEMKSIGKDLIPAFDQVDHPQRTPSPVRREKHHITSPESIQHDTRGLLSDLMKMGEESEIMKDVIGQLQSRISEIEFLRNDERRRTVEGLNQYEKVQLKQLRETRDVLEQKTMNTRVERHNILSEIERKSKELQQLERMIQNKEEELESLNAKKPDMQSSSQAENRNPFSFSFGSSFSETENAMKFQEGQDFIRLKERNRYLEDKNISIERKLKEAEERLRETERQISDLHAKLEQSKTEKEILFKESQVKIAKLNQEEIEFQTFKSKTLSQIDARAEATEKLSILEQRKFELQNDIDKLEDEKRKEQARLTDKIEEVADQSQKAKEVQIELIKLETMLLKTKSRLETAQDRHHDDSNEVRNKRKELMEMDRKISEKLSLLASLESSIASKREHKRYFASQNENLERDVKLKVSVSVHSILAKLEDFDTYNHTQIHSLGKRLVMLQGLVKTLSEKLRRTERFRESSRAESRFENHIVELKKEIGNKLMELRNLDKKIGRRKQVYETLQDSPLSKPIHQRDQLRNIDKQLEKKSLQLRQINHHLSENNKVWRKVKNDLENFGEYKLRLKEIVEEYEMKIHKIKHHEWDLHDMTRLAFRTPLSSTRSSNFRRDPTLQHPVDVNSKNVVDHISKELDVALSSLM